MKNLIATESSGRTRDCSVDVDTRGCKVADRSSRAVHLMFRMQRKQDVQSTGVCRVRLVLWVAAGIQHVQEILGICQPLIGNSRAISTVSAS
jgi:hypothetical protein